MKKNIFQILTIGFVITTTLIITSCKSPTGKDGGKPKIVEPYTYLKARNDFPFDVKDRNANLDFIFDLNSVGKTTIIVPRSEWNTLLENYDAYYKNEEWVHADFSYEKNGRRWTASNCGFRLRGNTTRVRPQGPDRTHSQGNHRWSDWQKLAAANPKRYRQSSFKIDFEKFLPDGEEYKMAGCMKSVNLKRFQGDSTYIREIYSYDFMRHYGVWTAPRACYTQLEINIFEDLTTGDYTTIDYGIYEFMEDTNKQSLKAREKQTANAWKNNNGNLWKCFEGATLLDNTIDDIGMEKTTLSKETSEFYKYDLKTNKKEFDNAKAELVNFMQELTALKTSTPEDLAETKSWFEKNIDVDLFLRLIACNVVLGMDDDYFGNSNNFYLYFDTKNKGTGKMFMIPFDYDHTLGQQCNGDGVTKNPITWGIATGAKKGDRPLMEKLIAIPEYEKLYKKYLRQFSAEDSYFGKDQSIARIKGWQNMIKPYIASPDLLYDHDTSKVFIDTGGWSSNRHYILQSPYVWNDKRKSILKYTAASDEL